MTFTHSFSAAAAELGYSQSAVSRQIAALERETGATLFERHRAGVRLTENGLILLRHARAVLDEIAAAERELTGAEPDVHDVRVGAFISAGVVVLPRALRALRNQRPDIRVTTREGSTPALVRALRAGTLDLAVISSRPPHRAPDAELPALVTEMIDETGLLLAAPRLGASPVARPSPSTNWKAWTGLRARRWVGSR